ncbi:paraquat-inducible protein A [Aliidiomarina minuta]|uniref:Paraquat-inducible protein A n=1 Tax=Aliidiomarina minuta TaxID=880057 RepID=A0A432W9X5_9GAMM|nr:paraquat-inducible protein A [Aliidiomarina minuta]RUO26835.1 paraquat-inducible protein A [Aliidiomarina minuta]
MARKRWRACPECDLVVALPALRAGHSASCPRCRRELTYRARMPAERVLAYASAAIVMLLLTLPYPFLTFSLGGMQENIILLDTVTALRQSDWPLLGLLIAMSIIVLPGMYLLAVAYVYGSVASRHYWPGSVWLARAISHIKPWLMTDVFLVGVLISLVKLLTLADIGFGWSFWAFCGYVVLMAKTVSNVDSDWLWFALQDEPAPPTGTQLGEEAWSQHLVGCNICGLLNRPEDIHCRRCARKIRIPGSHSVERTVALLVTAAILYVPANVYIMMSTITVGGVVESTIMGGVVQMLEMGSYLVAAVIFFASIVIPVLKIVVLGWLCYVVRYGQPMSMQRRARWYRVTEFIGRWSMIDVFVVAIMVALIQAGVILSISPGPAAAAFAAVVILTMLAAMSFDPKALWQPARVNTQAQEWIDEKH